MRTGREVEVVDSGTSFRDLVDARWRIVTGALVPLVCLAVVIGGVVVLDQRRPAAPAGRPGVARVVPTDPPKDIAQVLGVTITRPSTTVSVPPYVPPPQVDLDGPDLPDPIPVRRQSGPATSPTSPPATASPAPAPGPSPAPEPQPVYVVVPQSVPQTVATPPDPATVTSIRGVGTADG